MITRETMKTLPEPMERFRMELAHQKVYGGYLFMEATAFLELILSGFELTDSGSMDLMHTLGLLPAVEDMALALQVAGITDIKLSDDLTILTFVIPLKQVPNTSGAFFAASASFVPLLASAAFVPGGLGFSAKSVDWISGIREIVRTVLEGHAEGNLSGR